MDKLKWLNGQYLRRASAGELLKLLSDSGFEWPARVTEPNRERIAGLALERIKAVKEFRDLVGFLGKLPPMTKTDVVQLSKLPASTAQEAIEAAVERLARVEDWYAPRIGQELKQTTVDRWPDGDVKFRDAVRAYYVAVTGSPTSLPLFDAMEMLGKEESLERLKAARELLK
jgi:glutamyl-tRNA synthetase